MGAVLEVAIGLVFVFLMLSLVVSAANEGIAGLFSRRSVFLEKGIQNLLGKALSGKLYDHGLVRGLTQKHAWPSRKPSYVSNTTFSSVVLDLIGDLPSPDPAPAPDAGPAAHVRHFASRVAASASQLDGAAAGDAADFGQALSTLASSAESIQDLRKNLESWFDEAMDRVSGWYKRRTRIILFFVGVVLVASLNADTLNIGKTLWINPSVRTAVVNAAEKAAASDEAPDVTTANAAQIVSDLEQLEVPLGWAPSSATTDPRRAPDDFVGWLSKVLGLLITAVALTFGAPFWFDLLKRFVGLRSSGTPPEESADAQKKSLGAPTSP